MIRQPICILLAHVDHGKTSILDKIRGTAVTAKEAGGITQCISAYTIQLKTIKKICKNILDKKINFTIPGILFIDSPGHEAFTTLRKRGGNIADIAILVIDINEGLKPQTIESIEILKKYKTPFIIAANKIDTLSGWRPSNKPLLQNIKEQAETTQNYLDQKLYEIVGDLAKYNLNSERLDRIKDHAKEITIVPVSAKTGEGIPELLMVISGLAQKYLEDSLKTSTNSPGKATILEVTEEKGIGTTLDVIVYNGRIQKNDTILIGTLTEPIQTKVKALFEPNKKQLNQVNAACGVKISAPNIEQATAGMPIKVVKSNLEQEKQKLKSEIQEVLIETNKEGIIIKADTLGSLEALTLLLKEKNIKIKSASIGDITKKDIATASSELDELNKVIIGFNVKTLESSKEIKIITDNVIYKLIENLEKFFEQKKKELEQKQLEQITKPFKIQVLPNCIFRQSNPAIVGVEVLAGTLRTNTPVEKNNKKLTEVKAIQEEGKNISEAEKGKQVAVSLPGIIAGRQVKEKDILYSIITQEEFKKLKKFKNLLTPDEINLLKEYAEMKRKDNALWGV